MQRRQQLAENYQDGHFHLERHVIQKYLTGLPVSKTQI